ncbi:MAG: winged helix-turn-helix transcriptional regulator [Mailhella sp.]|nr:winged helix-turn-helix transcriptional regulator [Mailhella sp.]
MEMEKLPLQRAASRKYIEEQARIFKALGHPSRLLMAEALSRGPLCVCDLQKLVGADMSTISRHLSVLKAADIVADEKKGQNVYYSLKLSCLGQFLNCTAATLDKQAQARQAQLAAMMAP